MDAVEDLKKIKQRAALGGGQQRIDAQHKRGKLTARERINTLLDSGSFIELDTLRLHESRELGLEKQRYEGDSVITGIGQVGGRTVCVYSQDFTVLGGSLSLVAGQKISKVTDHALRIGCPVVGITDSGGARIQEGVDALAGYGEIFLRNTHLSGVVPQITVTAGPAAGGAVYSPALTDFIFMVEGVSNMFITGPDVIKAATGEVTSKEELGGAKVHATYSGVAHFIAQTEIECYAEVRRLLSYLPAKHTQQPPRAERHDKPDRKATNLATIIPDSPAQPYDMMEVITTVVDYGEFVTVHEQFAKNIIVGFARMNGNSVGIVANQPTELAGMLDINASDKAARFVRFCDAFNIPVITFVDVPGFMPGVDQEHNGIIRHGAKMLYAYAEATVPKLTVITRKAYGGAYIVMGSKHLRADLNLAWPSAEIAVMGPEGAANVIWRREIDSADDPKAKTIEVVEQYRKRFATPYAAANRGYIDDVIDPAVTRPKLVQALCALAQKRDSIPSRKHGNIPL